ncbi:MAG: BatD family protein, partial [Bacteroidaceae bacterium]|nr:BatD family protein [Bacteroidaceae bacterium]
PATTFEGIISIPVQSTDLFDAIFNAGRYIDIKKELVSNKQVIQVEALPAGKSGSFYGGVGNFSISSDINTT